MDFRRCEGAADDADAFCTAQPDHFGGHNRRHHEPAAGIDGRRTRLNIGDGSRPDHQVIAFQVDQVPNHLDRIRYGHGDFSHRYTALRQSLDGGHGFLFVIAPDHRQNADLGELVKNSIALHRYVLGFIRKAGRSTDRVTRD